MQSEWQTEIENLEVRHSLCIGDAALPKNLLFVRLWCDFVVNLRVHCKLEFRVLVLELFSISRLQRASPQSVRAVSVRFYACPELRYVRYCVTSGIVLLDYTCMRIVNFFHVRLFVSLLLHCDCVSRVTVKK